MGKSTLAPLHLGIPSAGSSAQSLRLYHKIHIKHQNLVRCNATSIPDPSKLLNSTHVILVSPKSPANIGRVLRLAANFDVASVRLVAPRCDPNDGEIDRLRCDAPGTLELYDSLEEALQDTAISIGFTRRAGAGRTVYNSLTGLLQSPLMLEAPRMSVDNTNSYKRALVFGREESGLLDAEVSLCGLACAIPSSDIFPSLNLSHAVAVILSQLYEHTLNEEKTESNTNVVEEQQAASLLGPDGATIRMATHSEIAALLERISSTLSSAGIDVEESTGGGDKSNHGRKVRPMGRVRSILQRSMLTSSEVKALHGVCKKLIESVGGNRNGN